MIDNNIKVKAFISLGQMCVHASRSLPIFDCEEANKTLTAFGKENHSSHMSVALVV